MSIVSAAFGPAPARGLSPLQLYCFHTQLRYSVN
jgi:hypothetical protein